MTYLTAFDRALQQAIPAGCAAKSLPPSDRQTLVHLPLNRGTVYNL